MRVQRLRALAPPLPAWARRNAPRHHLLPTALRNFEIAARCAPAETMALQALQGPGARLPQRRWSGMRTKAAGDASKGLNVLEWTGKLVPQGALVTGAPLGRDRARARRDRFS